MEKHACLMNMMKRKVILIQAILKLNVLMDLNAAAKQVSCAQVTN